MDQAIALHPKYKGSVAQVVDKGFLRRLIATNPDLTNVVNFNEGTRFLTAEDPQFIFYLRNLDWDALARSVGYTAIDPEHQYDFALSFARDARAIARIFYSSLAEDLDFEVFFDEKEQHLISGEDVEKYLTKIYAGEAEYVIALLSREYPKRIWTRLESQAFKERFGDGAVIPIWFADVPEGAFDESRRWGGFEIDPAQAIEPQVTRICEELRRKVGVRRFSPRVG